MRQNTRYQFKEPGIFSFNLMTLPPAAVMVTLVCYLLLNIALAILMAIPVLPPAIGLLGAIIINLIVLLFVRSEVVLPLYLLVAGPSVKLSLSSSGILSRLYIGNMLFFLVALIWLLLCLLPRRKAKQPLMPRTLLIPLLCFITVGVISLIYSHFFPDPLVTYTFPHSNTSIYVVNAAELMLLIGLPLFLIVVPGVVRTMRHARWIIIAYCSIGLLYALGTIFAAPLGLYSKEVILGVRRPQVFGEVSSGLGMTLVLFTSIGFGQALYATKPLPRTIWGILTGIFALATIMTFGRESWISLFLCLLAMTILYTRNWKILVIALIIPIFVLLIPGFTNFFDPTKTYGADRLKIWADAINIWFHTPIMGTGAGNYQFFDDTYGMDVVGVAHNQYLEVLAEMGVQGLLCLLWIMTVVGWTCFNIFRKAKTALGKSVALSYCGFFVAILFAGLFTSSFVPSVADGGGTAAFVSESYRWLLLGLVLSVPQLEKTATRSQNQEHTTIKPLPSTSQPLLPKAY